MATKLRSTEILDGENMEFVKRLNDSYISLRSKDILKPQKIDEFDKKVRFYKFIMV